MIQNLEQQLFVALLTAAIMLVPIVAAYVASWFQRKRQHLEQMKAITDNTKITAASAVVSANGAVAAGVSPASPAITDVVEAIKAANGTGEGPCKSS